ncbi:MAG: class I SAM-dependent methyltransferase [Promethearchaeota archaeon]
MLKEDVRNLIPLAIKILYNVEFPAAGIVLFKYIKEIIKKSRIDLPVSDSQLFSICDEIYDRKSIVSIERRLEEVAYRLEKDLKNKLEVLLDIAFEDLDELLTEAIEYVSENPDHIVFIMKDWIGDNMILINQLHVDVSKGIGNLYYGIEKGNYYKSILKKAFGDNYPEGLEPDGYITMSDLHNFVKFLNVGRGNTIIDLGCGKGGPGMWLAREIGCNYVGIDKSIKAIEIANRRIKEFGTDDKIKFITGDFSSTSFTDNQFDGAISADALQMIHNPSELQEALHEIYRILQVGAPFLFICGEVHFPKRVSDFRPLLKKAGFKIEKYDEIPDWEHPRRSILLKILESRDELIKEVGKLGASFILNEAQTDLPALNHIRRIFAVARKS